MGSDYFRGDQRKYLGTHKKSHLTNMTVCYHA